MFGIEVHHRGAQTVIAVGGELDLATAPAFRQATTNAVADGARHVVVDLSGCDHIDSIGVGLLLGVLKRARTVGGTLVVVCPDPRLRRVLDLTDLSRIVTVSERLDEALASPPPDAVPGGAPAGRD
jgi:anti-sigma B factor antagonist